MDGQAQLPDWLQSQRIVVVDTETTGLDVQTCEIVQMAMITICGETYVEEEFLVRPTKPIPEEATKIHGINDAMCEAALPASEMRVHVAEVLTMANTKYWDGPHTVIGYNALTYDWPIVQRVFGPLNHVVVLDPLPFVWALDRYERGKGRHQLINTAERWGIDTGDGKAHTALFDARVCWQVFCKMFGRLKNDRGALPQKALRSLNSFLDVQHELATTREADFQAWKARQPPQEKTT